MMKCPLMVLSIRLTSCLRQYSPSFPSENSLTREDTPYVTVSTPDPTMPIVKARPAGLKGRISKSHGGQGDDRHVEGIEKGPPLDEDVP